MDDKLNPRDLINGFLEKFGGERNLALSPLSDEGVSHVVRGSATVSIHLFENQGVLLLLSKVMDLPADASALYRRVLELSFLETQDAAFAINASTNELFLRCLRGLDGLDYDEFEDLVHTIASVADVWDDRLRAEFSL